MAKVSLNAQLAAKESRFSFNPKDYPVGAKVEYTGERVAERVGNKVGIILGHRPTNGLWVKFPNGKGSISVKFAKVLAAPKAAKKVAKATPVETPEPAQEPQAPQGEEAPTS